MNNSIKIYVVGGQTHYTNWIENVELVDNVEDSDLVFFTGGEDVHPDIYHESIHPRTYSNINRDLKEIEIMHKAVELGKKLIGVCRGSQFLCVMAGGSLVQDQPNPGFIHEIKTYKDSTIEVSSTHHQAQYPYRIDAGQYTILGWTEGMLPYHEDGNQVELNPTREVEDCFYRNINALAIQSHPEMLWDINKPMTGFEETISHYRELLKRFLNNGL